MNTVLAAATASLFLPDFFILLAQLAAGLGVSRAAGCFTGALSLPERQTACRDVGAVARVAALQMDAVSPSQWSGPSRHGLPALLGH